jgi:hypothetical protein
MALTKFLARDLTIEVRTAVGPDVWTHIGGLDTLTHSPSTERADTTGFDDQGRPTHIVAQRGDSWDIAGKALIDVGATGDATKDPGQLAVETLSRAIGAAAEGRFRITDPAGNEQEFSATAELTQPGGGTNDAASWGASLEVTGAPTFTPAA